MTPETRALLEVTDLGSQAHRAVKARCRSGVPKARWITGALVLVAAMAGLTSLAPADVIIMKDGFVMRGMVHKEKTFIVDKGSGQVFPSDKPTGFFTVDTGARLIIFNSKQVQLVDEKDLDLTGGSKYERKIVRFDKWRVPAGVYDKITPWDSQWDRFITILSSEGRNKITQHLSVLTPLYARVEARHYNWNAHFLTSELDPEAVARLLYDHPDLKMTGAANDVDKRFKIVNFLIQASMYDRAAAELQTIAREFPDAGERLQAKRADFKKIVVARYMDMIELAQRTGRHRWAQMQLARVPVEDLDDNLQSRYRNLQSKYEDSNKNLRSARALVLDLRSRLSDPGARADFQDAVDCMLEELNLDSVAKLQTFLAEAQQGERDRAQNRAVTHTPEQLLSLAISGWLLGPGAADSKVDAASRLWRTRRFLLQYQETHDPTARQQLTKNFESQAGLPVDEVAALVKSLPPPLPYNGLQSPGNPWVLSLLPIPEAKLWDAVATAVLTTPATNFVIQASLPWSNRQGVNYLVQPPPEYAPGRSYPVLLALHEAGLSPADMMARWRDFAARHGYILVAPAWERYTKKGYQFTPEEQNGALDALRDLRRRFWVDPDRVFIAGWGEGANMALDVGLSHPDLFAGVVSICGRPKYFSQRYWRNSQYLPCYYVAGDQDGEVDKAIRSQFEQMMLRGYPSLFVEYKGRGQEWFPGELPSIFDWLDRKKRVFPYPELGRPGSPAPEGSEFSSMRPTDDRFYWLSGVKMGASHINDGRSWSNKIGAATLQARANDKNQFNVNARGFKRVIVWFAPTMVDFEKPLNVYVNSKLQWTRKKISPSLETLLEDLYQRGDHTQVYVAKLELSS